jgi:hypothetical protein
MSASLALLEDWLQELVDLQVVTIEQAWQLQDLRLTLAPDEVQILPPELHPMASRIWLHETLEGPPTQ